MTLRDLSQLDLKRQQYRAILYLAEGGATFEELCQALGVSRTQGYEALSLLVRWGLVEKVNGRYHLSPALGKGGNRAVPPKNLDPLKDLARAGLRASEYQVLLYLAAAGEAGVEEVMEELGFKRAWAYRALSPLVRRGLVEKEGNKYRLGPALEGLFNPSEEKAKAKRARGKAWWPRAFREGPRGQTKKRLSAGRRARPMAPHRPADLASLWAKWRGTGSRG